MRFMVLVKATRDSEAGVMPDEALIAEMGRFNEELARAGVLLAADGLQPSAKGARVRFADGERTVERGPFPETRELVAGYWIFQVASLEEAIGWMQRCPSPFPKSVEGEIEIRQIFELADFDQMSPELRAREERLQAEVEGRSAAPH